MNEPIRAHTAGQQLSPRTPYAYGIILILGLLLLPRLFTAVGAPTVANFLHYPITFALYLIALLSYGPASSRLHSKLGMMLGVMLASALVNAAGLINVPVNFLILCQPFLIMAIMTSRTWTAPDISILKLSIFILIILHVALSYYQAATTSNTDDVKGLFLNMGAGHHVAGAVGLSAAIYFIASPMLNTFWARWLVPALAGGIVAISDAKQVVLIFGLSLAVLFMISSGQGLRLRFREVVAVARFALIPAVVLGVVAYFAIPTSAIVRFLSTAQEGFEQKFSVFAILYSYHDSVLNMALGLGPGHTISRLGWLFPVYSDVLAPLGGTRTGISVVVLYQDFLHYLTNPTTGSSLYSRAFSWAGIWGDLGVIGVFAYLSIWILIFRRYCDDFLSKYLVINVILFGLLFTWLEEPAFVGFVAVLVSLRWQESQQHQLSGM